MVMYFPSLPANGESLTDAFTETTGGSMGLQAMLDTFGFDVSVCVHFGTNPVTLTDTMSPATAFFIGDRSTPCTTVTSLTLPDATVSPSRFLAIILSPLATWPLKILLVT